MRQFLSDIEDIILNDRGGESILLFLTALILLPFSLLAWLASLLAGHGPSSDTD
jgi:hypothetical protein